MKYAQVLTGMSENEVLTMDPRAYDFKIKKFEQFKPNLYVNYWTELTATALTIRSWICRLRAKFQVTPDLIIIDYDDCLLPTTIVKDSMYENAGTIYADLISPADYFRCPILTFAQPQRDSWEAGSEAKLITSSKLAHSARKAHRCFSITSMNFDKNSDTGYLYIDIARRGESNVKIPIKKDLSRAKFWEIISNK